MMSAAASHLLMSGVPQQISHRVIRPVWESPCRFLSRSGPSERTTVCLLSSDIEEGEMKQRNQWEHVQETFGPVSLKGITSTGRGFRCGAVEGRNLRVGACHEQIYPWAPPQMKEKGGYTLAERLLH